MARKKSNADRTAKVRKSPNVRIAVMHARFRDDLEYWIQHDPKVALRLMRLIEEILRDPFHGIGKPEPLRALGPNIWSRRLTEEDRIVYEVLSSKVVFQQGRFHYE